MRPVASSVKLVSPGGLPSPCGRHGRTCHGSGLMCGHAEHSGALGVKMERTLMGRDGALIAFELGEGSSGWSRALACLAERP